MIGVTHHVTENAPAKTGKYLSDVPQFSKLCVLQKTPLNDNKHNSLYLAQKYVSVLVLGHYLFLKAQSFP